MKNFLALIIQILMAAPSFSQKTEFSFHINSGFFSFGGASSVKSSFLNISDVDNIPDYTNNPYGRRSGFSYGVGVQVQRITKSGFVMGLQTGVESLASKVEINDVSGGIGWTVEKGSAILKNNFVNIYPFVGKRFEIIKKLKTDVKIGFDLATGFSDREQACIHTSHGQMIETSVQRANIPAVDLRPRIELTNCYKRIALSLGYSYGLSNYASNLDGANFEIKARYFRAGISYLFN